MATGRETAGPEEGERRRRFGRRRRDRGPRADEVIGYVTVSEHDIYPQIFGNADREVGGVLVGRVPASGGMPLLTGAIPALSADEQRASLTFTQETWAHVHDILETDFPQDEKIVGWYHSHPNFGIFLSGHDLFIHENFFDGPSQIAVVVDPIGCTEGIFAWRDGEVVCLFERPTPSGWQPPDSMRPPAAAIRVPVEQPKPRTQVTIPDVSTRRLNRVAAITTVLVIVAAILVVLLLLKGGGNDAIKAAPHTIHHAQAHKAHATASPHATATSYAPESTPGQGELTNPGEGTAQ